MIDSRTTDRSTPDHPAIRPDRQTERPDEGPRGSTPETTHRGEDDDVAFERSPEFHDEPGSGRHRGPTHEDEINRR